MRHRRGFTLAELLVTLALVAVASLAIFGFYSIGIDSERRSRERSEKTSALRLVYKLLDDRIRRRGTEIHALYLKAGAFAAMDNLTAEIMTRPFEEAHPALESMLGYGDLAAAGIAGGTLGVLLSGVPGGRLEADGPFVLRVMLETGPLPVTDFELLFAGDRPGRFHIGGFAPGQGSVAARPAWRADTLETNDGVLHDLSPDPAIPSAASVSVSVERTAGSGPFLAAYASTGRAARIEAVAVPADVPVALTLFHIRGAALLADDGLLFHEPGPDGAILHALYLRRPPDGEGEIDEAGETLLELRYAMSIMRAGVREVFDDALLTNVRRMRFRYYDGEALEVVPGPAWSFAPGAKVVAVSFEIEMDRAGVSRADLPGWRK